MSCFCIGCCEDEEGSVRSQSTEPFLSSNYDPDTASQHDSEKMGPSGAGYPQWVKNDDALNCYGCRAQFSLFSERKHHCRRCRNVFCHACSAKESPILAYEMKEPVRVCDSCYTALISENLYMSTQRPVLQRGETFKKSKMMGMSSQMVKLKLMVNERALTYSSISSKSDAVEIPFDSVVKLDMTNLTSFEIGMQSGKSYTFEADSSATVRFWMDGLLEAIKRARQDPLHVQIEKERRAKTQREKDEETMALKAEISQRDKQRRKSNIDAIRDKYGFQS